MRCSPCPRSPRKAGSNCSAAWCAPDPPASRSANLRASTGLPGATLTNHLNVLRQSGLVASTREGRVIRCTANYDRMDELVAYLLESCCARGVLRSERALRDVRRGAAACCPR